MDLEVHWGPGAWGAVLTGLPLGLLPSTCAQYTNPAQPGQRLTAAASFTPVNCSQKSRKPF